MEAIVGPERCRLPDDLRTWGWAVQLYSLWSSQSTGIGDLADLRRLAAWSRELGAGVVLVSPLCAGQRPSPYYPTSRCFSDPVYLRVDAVGGVEPGPLIDRDAVWRLKRPALEAAFAAFAGDPAFDRFCAERGPLLDEFAAWCDPAHVEFQKWLQWQVDVQLAAVAAELPVMNDLPVGSDPEGFDAWRWRDVFERGATVGAPPDHFNTEGQDWGLPPLDPTRLREAGYEPFVHVVRAAFRHAGAVRIDHVMGLFRLWWVPRGAGPREGAYVHYPWEDLLGIVAAESVRSGAYVVGEDLGTVEPWVRETLLARGVLSYRVQWFDDEWPAQSLGAVTTHDLPTIAGVWSGVDSPQLRSRLADAATLDEVVERTYASLAERPSMVVVATLEDVLGVVERPNRPGVVDPRNWSVPLPKPLEEIEKDPLVQTVARRLTARRPRRPRRPARD